MDDDHAMTAADWTDYLRNERLKIARSGERAELWMWTKVHARAQAIVEKAAVLRALVERIGKKMH